MLALLLLVADIPQTEERVFGNWAVNCDNVRRCEATLLQAEDGEWDDSGQVLLVREAGPDGALSLAIDASEKVTGTLEIWSDGALLDRIVAGGNIRITGQKAIMVARKMADGNALEIRKGREVVAQISLKGASAMLRYIDAQQGRVGGQTALVATGTKAASAVPAAATLPQLIVPKTPKTAPERLSKVAVAQLAQKYECDLPEEEDTLTIEHYRLDAYTSLVLLPCGSGAYNFNVAAFILRSGTISFAPFDKGPDDSELGGDSPPLLTNASFADENGGRLFSSVRGRGIGDCGGSQEWVWDGTRFRLIEERSLGQCRGSVNWLTTFRSNVIVR